MDLTNEYVNPELTPEDVAKRFREAKIWVDGVNEILQITEDVEVRQVISANLKLPGVGKPMPDGLVPVQGAKQPTIILLPLFKEDVEVNDITELMLTSQSDQVAYFTEHQPGRIYLNGEVQVSQKWKGILLLHEAKHGQFFQEGHYRTDDPLDHWYEEAAVFALEHRIIQLMIGKKYTEFLAQETARFITAHRQGTGGNIPQIGNLDFVDEVFLKSMSSREESIRRNAIWLDIVFHMFEQIFPDSHKLEKAKFLQQIYGAPVTVN